jgi:hypothetical protein
LIVRVGNYVHARSLASLGHAGRSVFFATVVFVLAAACSAQGVPRTPEELCTRICADRAKQCSSHDCAIGCSLSLDRIVERETDRVVGCVARRNECAPTTWAECGTLVGPHADGGPLPPPPPSDETVQ